MMTTKCQTSKFTLSPPPSPRVWCRILIILVGKIVAHCNLLASHIHWFNISLRTSLVRWFYKIRYSRRHLELRFQCMNTHRLIHCCTQTQNVVMRTNGTNGPASLEINIAKNTTCYHLQEFYLFFK